MVQRGMKESKHHVALWVEFFNAFQNSPYPQPVLTRGQTEGDSLSTEYNWLRPVFQMLAKSYVNNKLILSLVKCSTGSERDKT